MKIETKQTYLFRAVSGEELIDIKKTGIRINPNGRGYVFGKLFALTLEDAVAYGNIIFLLDDLVTSIVKVSVPYEIYKKAELIEADGMNAVLIQKEYLTLLKVCI